MKLLLLSAKLFLYGCFCDLCSDICTKMVEKNILKKRELNKKLLIKMSNLSNSSLIKWQSIEHRFILLSLERKYPE